MNACKPGPGMTATLLALVALSACASRATGDERGSGRVMPPKAVTCDRNQLTAYSGRVTDYRRDPAATEITIHTDWDTVETVLVRHAGGDGPITHFLIGGEPFSQADWPRIESAPGRLIGGMRATAWECADGHTATLVDWRPASE